MDIDKNKIVLDFPSHDVHSSYIDALREGFRRGIAETRTDDEIEIINNDFAAYIKELNAPPDGEIELLTGEKIKKVPYETLWLMADDVFIGEFSFRHELNDFLEQFGGHVGYGIRPALEGKGYGTLGLKLTLERAAGMGMDKLLITCDPDNKASEKIILKNKGNYHDTLDNPYGYGPTKRFWVPTIN